MPPMRSVVRRPSSDRALDRTARRWAGGWPGIVATLLILGIPLLSTPPSAVAGDQVLTLEELMQIRQIRDPAISRDGAWVTWALEPDRGDGAAVVAATTGDAEHRVERGADPQVAPDGRHWAVALAAPFVEQLAAADGKSEDRPRPGLVVVRLADGERVLEAAEVERFEFSGDGRWLARQHHRPRDAEDAGEDGTQEAPSAEETTGEREAGEEQAGEESAPPEGVPAPATPEEAEEETTPQEASPAEGDGEEPEEDPRGRRLVLLHLESGREVEIPAAAHWAFDATGRWLAVAVVTAGGEANRVELRDLEALAGEEETAGEGGRAPVAVLRAEERGWYASLTWSHREAAVPRLAFVAAVDDDEGRPGDAEVLLFDGATGDTRAVASSDDAPEGWYLPAVNELTFSRGGERLFFGFKPQAERGWSEEALARAEEKQGKKNGAGEDPEKGGEEEAGEEEATDPFDLETILEDREVTVWHGRDPLIQPNQKEQWEERRDRVYLAVVHLDGGDGDRVVPLADETVTRIEPSDNPRAVLGWAAEPYYRERTWAGFFADLYRVDLTDGSKVRVAARLSAGGFGGGDASLSPTGRHIVFWQQGHWWLHDGEDRALTNLTQNLQVPFADEDHDYPSPPPGYGVAGWTAEDRAVLLYDKFDLWRFPAAGDGAEPVRLTEGRGEAWIHRRVDLDPDDPGVDPEILQPGQPVILSLFNDRTKSSGLARLTLPGKDAAAADRPQLEWLIEGEKRFTLLAQAEDADEILYTRESYTEFPDLWVADPSFSAPRKLSDANPGLERFDWGRAELVEWLSADGEPLQGVLIKPEDWQPGQRLPVLVYFYRFFSQRLHEFNEPVVNHRPSFPFWVSHGYAVFLPDVRFEVGRPGLGPVKSLVPGVQKLVEMGVADPDAVGLHGHSWSGYQAAHVITQTHLFKAAVAGAPVSNMTSAYGGIRYGSGLARQFQYEMSQSRIGGSLWDARAEYIDNSPLFFADRIETPLLIQFGDEDEAVPWTQGIELYLALRRLGKEVIFLQYEGEPHHLRKYANKVDYTLKMKQFFDHHLKGEPAPSWMTEGVPYRGEEPPAE